MKVFIILMVLTMLISCNTSPMGISSKDDKDEYIFINDNDSLVVYSIIRRIVPIEKENFNVEKAIAELKGFTAEVGNIQNTATMENIFSTSYPVSSTEKLCCYVFKGKFFQDKIADINFDFYFTTNYGIIRKSLPKQNIDFREIVRKNEFLKLIPGIKEIDNNSIEFQLLAIRQTPNQGSFMPSSENFRVEITNASNPKVWNSSDGQMFMQMIESVLPIFPGTENYVKLNYIVDKTKFKLNGKNTVTFIIPAMPDPMSVTTNYWKR